MRLPHRKLIRLTGPDSLALLERTVTNSVADWAEGDMRYGALLTPQGKIIADYLALRTRDGVLLDVHEDAAEDLMKRLKMFRLRAAVDIDVTEKLAAVIVGDIQRDPRDTELPGRDYLPLSEAGQVMSEADWSAKRIAAGVPEWGDDYRAADVFPTDINMDMMHGIDYRKGCFVGQEVASRMKRKGKIRKRTLKVSGEALAVGADVLADAPIGTVTSMSGTIGLALIRTDRLARAEQDGKSFTCNGSPVRFDLAPWQRLEINAQLEDVADD